MTPHIVQIATTATVMTNPDGTPGLIQWLYGLDDEGQVWFWLETSVEDKPAGWNLLRPTDKEEA